MSAEGNKFRNRPDEDPSTRRTAEGELMRGEGRRGDRGVGQSGDGSTGGSGTAGGGLENEGTGSLMVDDPNAQQLGRNRGTGETADEEGQSSGSTTGARTPDVSGQRGMSGGAEKEGEGRGGPDRSGAGHAPATEQDRAADQNEDDNAREGYEDHGSSREADGSSGESSGSTPGYR